MSDTVGISRVGEEDSEEVYHNLWLIEKRKHESCEKRCQSLLKELLKLCEEELVEDE